MPKLGLPRLPPVAHRERLYAQLDAWRESPAVDTKKKELVGPFKNAGRTWRPKGKPQAVKVHDFIDPELGRASPYGLLRPHS